jgi:tetraacyldisaccharide 4'-kinase
MPISSSKPAIKALSSFLLSPVSLSYGFIQQIHAFLYKSGLWRARRSRLPIVSVGNIVMGGSGKTPMTVLLAESLIKYGFKPAILSRGYGGSNRSQVLTVSLGDGSGPLVPSEICGDEPFLMAKRLPDVPVLISRKRYFGAETALDDFGCNVGILDDGFQHLSLRRDVDIVMLNGNENSMFPVGNLREPVSALQRANVFVIADRVEESPAVLGNLENPLVFRSKVHLGRIVKLPSGKEFDIRELADTKVLLVSAIANPERFSESVVTAGGHFSKHIVYPDHHKLSDQELRGLLDEKAEAILVTEKDAVKLPAWFTNEANVFYLPISLLVDELDRFMDFVISKIRVR